VCREVEDGIENVETPGQATTIPEDMWLMRHDRLAGVKVVPPAWWDGGWNGRPPSNLPGGALTSPFSCCRLDGQLRTTNYRAAF
jgi:hypothetical protein